MSKINLRFAASLVAIAMGAVLPPVAMRNADGLPNFKYNKRGKGYSNKRGKGKISRPRKHSNMLIISKRVRRKHARG